MQNTFYLAVGVCCLLKCNSVVNMMVMRLVLDDYIYPVIMQKYLPFTMYCEVCCCLRIK